MNRIVVTGGESTGKTELSVELAGFYGFKYIPEFAREYVENLKRPYNFEDVIKIAEQQLHQYENALKDKESVVFDTWLLVTKVWLDIVYQKKIDWVDQAFKQAKIDLYLLCSNDIPWVPDQVRENGGEMRDRLFGIYQKELEMNELPFRVITGKGEERLKNAIFAIENFFKED